MELRDHGGGERAANINEIQKNHRCKNGHDEAERTKETCKESKEARNLLCNDISKPNFKCQPLSFKLMRHSNWHVNG